VELTEKLAPKRIGKVVQGMSLRASLSLGIGIGEWLLWRLNGLSPYRQSLQYVEALWARTVDYRYLKTDRLDRPEDNGDPAVGPLLGLEHGLYIMMMDSTLDHPDRGQSVAQLVPLVRYTLTDASPFDKWLQVTLRRFSDNFAFDPQNRGGSFVPRAFLDPEIPIDTTQISHLLDEQLRSIDYRGNPFLATPEEMLAAGFKGTPYRYQ
jgi:hypothetical protein